MPVSASTDSSRSSLRRLLLAPDDLVEPPSLDDVRVVDVAGRSEQPRPLLERQRLEQAPVADDRLEHLGGGLQPLDDAVLRRRLASCSPIAIAAG